MESDSSLKKYSKISPALKSFFLESLYFKGLTIKEASARLKLNYSTAKVLIRDLTPMERKFVRRMINKKEAKKKAKGEEKEIVCQYRVIQSPQKDVKDHSESDHSNSTCGAGQIQIISRVSYDFFAAEVQCD